MGLIASVLFLDRQAIKALRVTDPYSLHRVVYSLYEDVRSAESKAASEPSGILYADQGGDFRGRRVLLLSNREPKKCVEGKYGQVVSRQVGEKFLAYEQYRFKVIISPTRRDSASRKLVPVKGREAVADWFSHRAEQSWGFVVSRQHLQVDRLEVLQFNGQQHHKITLAQAHIQGQLRVTDPECFRNSFSRGIGRGRAFGCGLLQVVPLLDNSIS